MTVEYSLGSTHKGHPDIESVMGSLFSDASCAQGSFEDFCSDIGYDTDSRLAEKIYKACKSINIRLHKFIDSQYDAMAEYLRKAGF